MNKTTTAPGKVSDCLIYTEAMPHEILYHMV